MAFISSKEKRNKSFCAFHVRLIFRAKELNALGFVCFGCEDQKNSGSDRKNNRYHRNVFEKYAPRYQE
jgi:hypothetical protein